MKFKYNRTLTNVIFLLYGILQQQLGFPVIKKEFERRTGYVPNLKKPRTFNEKVVHRLLYKRNRLIPVLVDKVRVRDYVEKIIGKQHLIPLLGIYNDASKIEFRALPSEYIIKTNFTSGRNILVTDNSCINPEEIISQLQCWMNDSNYGLRKLLWFVPKIPRRIVIERLIKDENGDIPSDYKIFCFHGKAHFIEVHNDRFSNYNRAIYDVNWVRQDVSYSSTKTHFVADEIPAPKLLREIVDIAEKLAGSFEFVRIDLYAVGGRVYFGEYTFSPVNGNAKFNPKSFDSQLGELWEYKSTGY